MPLDPQIADALELMAASGYPPLHEGTPSDARKAIRAMTVDAVKPEDVVQVGAVDDITVPGGAGERPARIYRPEGGGPFPTLVYFHGGGWVIGDLDTHDQTCRRLCDGLPAVVVSVDYRLAPEHPFPAAVDDALAAVAWACEDRIGLGGSATVALGGDSAGGNLAAVASQAMPGEIDAQLLIYPAVDLVGEWASKRQNAEGYFLEQELMDWFGRCYLGGVEGVALDDVRLSPYRAESLAGQPPAVVATAEFDPLRDEGQAYAESLGDAGVEVDAVCYDGMIHGFLDFGAFSPAASDAVGDLVGRFARLLAR